MAVIGGGGVRAPLLVEELLRRRAELPVDELQLLDVDPRRLKLTVGVIREQLAQRSGFRVVWTTSPKEALTGADFVISMARVGGERARVIDEQVPIRHGVIGQETTGPGGFAMAMRTIPVLVEYARMIRQVAPRAWVINLTNPAGIITQALMETLDDRVIGVCDSPSALFRELRSILAAQRADQASLRFEYMGLNHLGWVTGIWSGGQQLLPWLLDRADRIRHHGLQLFDPGLIRALGAVPTEYLYFYYHRDRALRSIRESGRTRGEEVLALNEALYRRLEELASDSVAGEGEIIIEDRSAGSDPSRGMLAAYREYIRSRESSYFRLEAGVAGGDVLDPSSGEGTDSGGYEKVAAAVMAAIVNDSKAELTLLVRNRSALSGLEPDDVVEVPCIVDASGARPMALGEPPTSVRGLIHAVKAHERLTLEAAHRRTYASALSALLAHPLVGDADTARRILDDYLEAHRGFLE